MLAALVEPGGGPASLGVCPPVRLFSELRPRGGQLTIPKPSFTRLRRRSLRVPSRLSRGGEAARPVHQVLDSAWRCRHDVGGVVKHREGVPHTSVPDKSPAPRWADNVLWGRRHWACSWLVQELGGGPGVQRLNPGGRDPSSLDTRGKGERSQVRSDIQMPSWPGRNVSKGRPYGPVLIFELRAMFSAPPPHPDHPPAPVSGPLLPTCLGLSPRAPSKMPPVCPEAESVKSPLLRTIRCRVRPPASRDLPRSWHSGLEGTERSGLLVPRLTRRRGDSILFLSALLWEQALCSWLWLVWKRSADCGRRQR